MCVRVPYRTSWLVGVLEPETLRRGNARTSPSISIPSCSFVINEASEEYVDNVLHRSSATMYPFWFSFMAGTVDKAEEIGTIAREGGCASDFEGR